MSSPAILETHLEGLPVRRGKVRDVYDLGDRLLVVASDRLSAFDWVLPTGIPDKGKILTGLSLFWFDQLAGLAENHLITGDLDEIDLPQARSHPELRSRVMLVHKAEVVPIECVVRGYLAGSGWRQYRESGEVCGVKLPDGLREADRLPSSIFTPATKAASGHDENISFEQMVERVGAEAAKHLRDNSIAVYERAAEIARPKGIIISDTKFEWGRLPDGRLIVIDEVLTPDSSRFWPMDTYEPGGAQRSFDKQFARDYLDTCDWDKNSPPPPLPDDIVAKTRQKYIEAYERLTGHAFET